MFGCVLTLSLVLASGSAPGQTTAAAPVETGATWLSPTALTATKDGQTLYVACATANCVLRMEPARRIVVESIHLPASPSGLALSADERQLFVTCAGPKSTICVVALPPENPQSSGGQPSGGAKVIARILAGHTAIAPVLSRDGKWLYVCNRFNHAVSVIDLAAAEENNRIAVQREPVAAARTRDGRHLLVANHLQGGRADIERV
ncbi:MAG TPA: hypothetical protein VNZ22_21115, partial [Bacillota bacterium]|nr:hypothetical protein [Bacillota bacterium]